MNGSNYRLAARKITPRLAAFYFGVANFFLFVNQLILIHLISYSYGQHSARL